MIESDDLSQPSEHTLRWFTELYSEGFSSRERRQEIGEEDLGEPSLRELREEFALLGMSSRGPLLVALAAAREATHARESQATGSFFQLLI